MASSTYENVSMVGVKYRNGIDSVAINSSVKILSVQVIPQHLYAINRGITLKSVETI